MPEQLLLQEEGPLNTRYLLHIYLSKNVCLRGWNALKSELKLNCPICLFQIKALKDAGVTVTMSPAQMGSTMKQVIALKPVL